LKDSQQRALVYTVVLLAMMPRETDCYLTFTTYYITDVFSLEL